MTYFYIVLLILILCIIFRDVIFKMRGKKDNLNKSKRTKSQKYIVDAPNDRSVFIDVLDTDIKVLGDNSVQKIIIETVYLVDEYFYNISHDETSVKIIRNNKENFKDIGNSGRVLIRIPEKSKVNKLNIVSTNGDIEFYDFHVNSISIKCNSGIVKFDNVESDELKIFKAHGDVNLNHSKIKSIDMDIKNGNGDFVDVYGENVKVNVTNGDFIFVNALENKDIKDLKVNVLNGKKKIKVNNNLNGNF